MLFKLSVTADACEIGLKVVTRACLAAMGSICRMFHMSMLTNATCAPSIDIEAFAPGQPMLTDFFGAPRDKGESFAVALVAIVFHAPIAKELLLVELEQVPTEALGIRADAEALVLRGAITFPSDVNATFHGFIGVLELPCKHLASAWSHTDLLDKLEDLTL